MSFGSGRGQLPSSATASGPSQAERRSSRVPVPSSRYRPEDYQVFQREILTRQNFLPGASSLSSSSAAAAASRSRPQAAAAAAAAAGAQQFSRRVPAVHRAENRLSFQERGETRSGGRFAARNLPYFSSLRELLAHHQRLLDLGPVVSTRYARIARGTILQTCIRFRSDHSDIRGSLTRVLTELFQELDQGNRAGEGFEVSVTFNAVLSNKDSTSFSLFYGQNYGEGSPPSRLGLSNQSVVVRNLLHLRRIPTEFNLEDLVRRFSLAFDSSDLVVARILNVVYLVHQVSLSEKK